MPASKPIRLALARDPAPVAEIARRILNAHFPESIRQDTIHSRASSLSESCRRARPSPCPSPRDAGRGDAHALLRLRARPAHLRPRMVGNVWASKPLTSIGSRHLPGRPDVVQNGLALCSLHHKIFDLGAFTVLPGNHQIVFSRHLMGGDDTKAKFLVHHGAGLIQPQGRECLPQPEFLAWHRAEVFKEPARE